MMSPAVELQRLQRQQDRTYAKLTHLKTAVERALKTLKTPELTRRILDAALKEVSR